MTKYPDEDNKVRILELDFTKGILVILMIIYHSINYFSPATSPRNYLLFLPTSFTMISGFIITNIYKTKYIHSSDTLTTRLVSRSLKIFILFTAVNMAALLIFPRQYNGVELNVELYLRNWVSIYILGGSRQAALEVLLPISYLLLISIPILKLITKYTYFIYGIILVSIIFCMTAEHSHNSIYNIDLVSAGIVGMAIGLIPQRAITDFMQRSFIILLLFFSLNIISYYAFGDMYIIQIYSTMVCITLIYAIGSRIDLQWWYSKQVRLIGRYSLLAYIIQILFLQIIVKTNLRNVTESSAVINIVLVIFMITWLTIICVEYARSKSYAANGLYKMIFG
jgi:hypothetical protein